MLRIGTVPLLKASNPVLYMLIEKKIWSRSFTGLYNNCLSWIRNKAKFLSSLRNQEAIRSTQCYTRHSPTAASIPRTHFNQPTWVAGRMLKCDYWSNWLGHLAERRSFHDQELGPVPTRSKGECVVGNGFNKYDCNKKIINQHKVVCRRVRSGPRPN